MKGIHRKFSMLVIMLLLLYAAGIYIQFAHQNDMRINAAKDRANLSVNLLARDIVSHLRTNGQVVSSISDYLEATYDDEEQIQFILKKSMVENPFFNDIYYVDYNNKIISGNSLALAADFDARKREWYVRAVGENKRIITDEYLSTSGNYNIITIAEPVRDEKNNILGVIGGEVKLDGIRAIINNIYNSERAFIIDGNGHIIYQNNDIKNHRVRITSIEDIGLTLGAVLGNENSDPQRVTFDGQKALATFKPIENTNWKVGSIILYEDNQSERMLAVILLFITSLFGIFFLGILIRILNNGVMSPLIKLEKSLKHIDLAENVNYRVPEDKKSPFDFLNTSINRILDKNQEYLGLLEREEGNLRSSLERNKLIINAIPDTLFIVNKEGKFVELLKSNGSDVSFANDEIIGKSISEVFSGDFEQKALEKISFAIETGKLQICEHENMVNNEMCLLECRLMKSSENEVLVIARDVTKQRELEKELEYLSYHDALTGAHNRRFFEMEVEKVDKKENLPISVVMADVNGLKSLNDSFGHDAGDALLIKASNAMAEVVKGRFKISRIGGDEFIIIMPKTNLMEAEAIVKKIAKRVEREKVYSKNISISFGCETKVRPSHKLMETINRAEKKMYIEKEASKS